MSRYILRDNYSGFVFGDTADFASTFTSTDDPQADSVRAARMIDEDIGVGAYARTYEWQPSSPRDTSTGYYVYSVSESFPPCADGQDREYIDAVQRDCEYVGYVAILYDYDYNAWHHATYR